MKSLCLMQAFTASLTSILKNNYIFLNSTGMEENMYTGGYDIALQFDEELFNRALAAMYYKGMFYVKNKYAIDYPGLPPALKKYADISYMVKLSSPPFIDFVGADSVNVILYPHVILYILGGITVELDADLTASVKVVYSSGDHSIKLDFSSSRIASIHLHDTLDLDKDSLKKLNGAVAAVVQSGLLQNMETVAIPANLFQLQVPTVPDTIRLSVNRFDGKVMDGNCFQAGIDLFQNAGGVFSAIQLGAQADYKMAITEKVVQQIIDFWWQNTTMSKTFSESASEDLTDIQTIVNDVDTVAEVALGVATGGLVEANATFSNSKLNYGATITLGKPTVDIAPGDNFSLVNTQVHATVWATVTTDITTEVDVLFGLINVSSSTVTDQKIIDLSKDIDITLEDATGHVYLNPQLQLMGKVDQVDLKIDLGQDWLDKFVSDMLDTIIGWVKDKIIANIPEIPLFPAIIDFNVASLGYTLEIEPQELSTTDADVLIRLNADIKELKRLEGPLPGFVGNTLTRKVHRGYCKVLDEMDETDKVGYFSLMDAISDGYDACAWCIPWFNKP